MSGATSAGGPEPEFGVEQNDRDLSAASLANIELLAARRLIATAVGVSSPAVNALVDWLTAHPNSLDTILSVSLSNPDRLKAVQDTGLLDGGPHAAIDHIAEMIAEAVRVSFASVSLVLSDRQIVVGCNLDETTYPRSRTLETSLSKFVVAGGEPLIVNDAHLHPLLGNLSAVQDEVIRAFAGIPLPDGRGNIVGTVSVWGSDRYQWTNGQIQILGDLTDVACASIFGDAAFGPPVGKVSGKRNRGRGARSRRLFSGGLDSA